MNKTQREILNSCLPLKDGLISCMNEFAKQAFEAGRAQRTVRTEGNWNPNDFSDYEEHEVPVYNTFEDYLKIISQ